MTGVGDCLPASASIVTRTPTSRGRELNGSTMSSVLGQKPEGRDRGLFRADAFGNSGWLPRHPPALPHRDPVQWFGNLAFRSHKGFYLMSPCESYLMPATPAASQSHVSEAEADVARLRPARFDLPRRRLLV